MISRRIAVALLLVSGGLAPAASAEEPAEAPWIDRLEPFGAARGETVEIAVVGKQLGQFQAVAFDSPTLEWIETLSVEEEIVRGRVRVAPRAGLGAHVVSLRGRNGRANSRLFYVDQLPSAVETEPNDTRATAQPLRLRPQVLHGSLPAQPDRDFFRFEATAGERWVFDVRSIEYGGFLECDLTLSDAEGRTVAFNDDRDDYLETPRLEHRFDSSGLYFLKIDQYRGPQRVNCNANCGYMLRVSQTPIVQAAFPLGARRGAQVDVSIRGRALDALGKAWLVPARNAEHYRLTFPFTMPLLAGPEPDEALRVDGEVLSRAADEAVVRFRIPADVPAGLWRLWVASEAGPAEGVGFEIDDLPEISEAQAGDSPLAGTPAAVNGSLDEPGQEDAYRVQVQAGRRLHVAALAVQMGLPRIDPVLELFSPDGKLLAEHDDLMSGQGTVIGNLDSSLYFTPRQDGELNLRVRDRIGRGGPSFVYRLKIDSQAPGFAVMTDAENPRIAVGGESEIGVLLIRDPGFQQAVDVWVENPPPGLTFSREQFRADQYFGPSGDGDNVVIPDAFIRVSAAAEVAPGEKALRIVARAEDGRTVEAFSTLWIGPPTKRNDVRRPLPAVTLTVVER